MIYPVADGLNKKHKKNTKNAGVLVQIWQKIFAACTSFLQLQQSMLALSVKITRFGARNRDLLCERDLL